MAGPKSSDSLSSPHLFLGFECWILGVQIVRSFDPQFLRKNPKKEHLDSHFREIRLFRDVRCSVAAAGRLRAKVKERA